MSGFTNGMKWTQRDGGSTCEHPQLRAGSFCALACRMCGIYCLDQHSLTPYHMHTGLQSTCCLLLLSVAGTQAERK